MAFGERIKEIRKRNNMTQTELAELMKVTKGTVSTWETNRRTPSVDTYFELGSYLGVDIGYLLGDNNNNQSTEPTEEEIEQICAWAAEDYIREDFEQMLELDVYGKEAVRMLIQKEYERCKEQNTLVKETNTTVNIKINMGN